MLQLTPSIWFAQTPALALESLFHPGGTASGWYKRYKNRIQFFDRQGNPFACLVNRGNDYWFVSTHKTSDGRLRYLFACTTEAEKMLGTYGMGYTESHELAKAVWHQNQEATV